MCSITALLNRNAPLETDRKSVLQASLYQQHRGPDWSGIREFPEAIIAHERLAIVEQRQGRTELLLYRRSQAAVQRVPIEPAGVPRAVSLDAQGKRLAVQVSRDGRWPVDLIRLP